MAAAVALSPGAPRIGWVLSGTPENSRHLLEAMRAGLADEGLIDGQNVELDVRFNSGRSERYVENFNDLVRKPVNVLAASGYAGISAARDAAGGRIPVSAYFCGNDVRQMVASFARPGGNVTGVSCLSAELASKRIELLKNAVPAVRRLGFLYDPRSPGKEGELAETVQVAGKLGMSVTAATASSADGLEEAVASLRREGAQALVISEDAFTFSNRAQIVALGAAQGMIDISAFREFVVAGWRDVVRRERGRTPSTTSTLCSTPGSRGGAWRSADRSADAVRIRGECQGGSSARRHDRACRAACG